MTVIGEPEADKTGKQGGDDGDLGTRLEVDGYGELGILDAGEGIDDEVESPHLGDALQQGHIVEPRDIGRGKPKQAIEETGYTYIEIEDGTESTETEAEE